MERLIALDTETTGIEVSAGHRVIEIGMADIIDRKITEDEYQQYIKPDIKVGESFNIHGISDKFLQDKAEFAEIAEEFLEYIDGAILVIHNAPFDLGFLNNELALMGVETRIEDRCEVIDSLALSKKQRPGGMHNLDALCRRFDIDTTARTKHGALLDAKILAEVYLAMTGGQFDLFKADDNSKAPEKTIINEISNKHGKIKIIPANKAEQQAHDNYFKA